MLKASPAPPPEEVKMEADLKHAPAPPQKRATVEELEQVLLKSPSEREKVQKAKAKRKGDLLKASPAPPPEEVKMEADLKHAPAPPQKRATVEELEQELLKSPSEREKVQKAKERFKPKSTAPHASRFSLSSLNPLRVEEAEATAGYSATLAPVLDPNGTFRLTSTSPFAYAGIVGADLGSKTPKNGYLILRVSSYTFGSDTRFVKGYIFSAYSAPIEGWYIININLKTNGTVSLLKWEPSTGYSNLFTSPSSGGVISYDYPMLAYLAAGNHYFYWIYSNTTYFYYISYDLITHPW
jgi:hypothetical protein